MVSDPSARGHSDKTQDCLNPCSNGIWSLTVDFIETNVKFERLNPCSNGIWSLTLLPLLHVSAIRLS